MIMSRRPIRALFLALCASLTLPLARAQDHSLAPPNDRRPDQFQNMTSQLLLDLDARLHLTDEQKAKLVKIKKEFQYKHRDELKQLRQDVKRVQQSLQQARQNKNALAVSDARGQVQALRRAAEKLRAEFERQLREILSDAQKEQYDALKKERSQPGKKVTR
jgi:Spy/CpxP family protein refolding chaperone